MPDYEVTDVRLITRGTPADDGFFFPAEWEPHESTIMAFPPAQNWLGHGLQSARREWATVANSIAEFEPVLMVAHPHDRQAAQRLLNSDIRIIEFPINDAWARDTGPMILRDGQGKRRVAGFTFNGWGRKSPSFADDALLKARLGAYLDMPMHVSSLVLEGGGVALDGEGTIITTEECVLHVNRNPHLTKTQVEASLKRYLGAKKVIWLGRGLTPDPWTDGHVDGMCAFAGPGTVLLHTTDDQRDPNFPICTDARRRLQQATDARGRKLKIIEIPLGRKLAHMNFYIVNGAIIVPIANDPKEDDAPLAILRKVFADRKIIGISGRTMARGGGGIHCITQQVPQAA